VALPGGSQSVDLGTDPDGKWTLVKKTCPECKRLIIDLGRYKAPRGVGRLPDEPPDAVADPYEEEVNKYWMVYPRGSGRSPIPAEVPPEIASDFREAALVIADSPTASAAVSRRCLQHVLRTTAGVKHTDLAKEIQEVLDRRELPSRLAEAIDAVRQIGNFAAHPMKITETGAIVEVEPGEAEWNLDVLESVFDFYYVQPAIIQAKKDALNKKLASLGKPPLK
jgi:hypothetical protein